ncbi:MAG: lysophospholipase [Gammaproteobacteria bacterium RIFCSPLOWO2_02_FULL_56_15]|nr:MAG: lysophospholipase [Gammaproteobacteria bacterium RIFCSPLOWO2_02_FULL_56_15]
MSLVKRMLLSLTFIIVASWLGIVLLAYFFQSHLIYYPEKELVFEPGDIGLDFEEVWLETGDELTIHGWYVPHPAPRATVLFLHGNAGNISHRLDTLRLLYDLGLAALIIDYRGYGNSEGRPTEQGTYLDADAAWTYLTETRGVQAGEIIVMGRSLGAAIAISLAEQNSPGLLVVESAFTSIADLAEKLYPILPVRWIIRIHYPSIDRISNVRCPVLIVHSPEDEIIPFEFGEALFDRARPPKQFLRIRGDHNDGFMLSGDSYRQGLDEFITRIAP